MQRTGLSIGLVATLTILTVNLFMTGTAVAQETVLYGFKRGIDGQYPVSTLTFDTTGNLYGTTSSDDRSPRLGTVFELTPQAGGGWTFNVVHTFAGKDGSTPEAGVVLDTAGNLYGTTYAGGAHTLGTVFELTPHAGGGWIFKLLHSFGNGNDGSNPEAGLVLDNAGNLYGTTYAGGAHALGTVFELTLQTGGRWTKKVLHSFGKGMDGSNPYASVILDPSGNLYGTTLNGGTYGRGTVFELKPQAGGGWVEQILHSFGNGTDGYGPAASLTFDTVGDLYGTTFDGGVYLMGAVFELIPDAGGGWSEQVLYNFDNNNNGNDGVAPHAGVVFDSAGNIWGTTLDAGAYNQGTIFELSFQTGGGWSETLLLSFNGSDGESPVANLILDTVGNLYGTTEYGGPYGQGTVFEITP